ncbi:MarR family transcriptional regulator [Nocardia sp. NBC_01503]|uniref:MarR family winged helix-turn-helix transcriptional regulator n=1 Tax=Nocardia sp. NBC_01503 TaxID=2975997 RepID=UPI002E7B6799|nr:MarR family transcriptional regulator [Nocardia sp. NBC_01503]WTL31710.1 MarR family transcriptional regulator [Nocardia sp. NBC_01503]
MAPDPDPQAAPTPTQARTQLRRYGLESEIDPRAVLVAVRLLAAGTELGQATEAHFARFGLSTGRYRLLADLEDAGGEKSPSQLAAGLGVTRATVTGLIDGLEQQGLVCRRASAQDGRAVVVVLTARGARQLRDMAPEHFGRLQSMVAPLTPAERTTFLDLLERIRQGMRALTAD